MYYFAQQIQDYICIRSLFQLFKKQSLFKPNVTLFPYDAVEMEFTWLTCYISA